MIFNQILNEKNAKIELTLSFDYLYRMWERKLIEFELSIFEWSNLPYPQRELEIILCTNGIAGMGKNKMDAKYVYSASLFNPGSNYGSYKNVTLTSVGHSTIMFTKDVILIRNNEIGESSYARIRKYATMLAHADLTLQAALINYRKNGTISASNDASAKSIDKWYRNLTAGKLTAIVTPQSMESIIQSQPVTVSSVNGDSASLIDCITACRNVLRLYYAEIGVNMSDDKRERMVTDEVSSNDGMLLYNIDSMYKCRKQAAKEISEYYDIDCNVAINKRIGESDYDR